ncbi:MAG: sodium:proton antiporter [Acidobacteria bacterium]|nr:MAG: sodium:proton antiporter [Acidobacteriota bacterium]
MPAEPSPLCFPNWSLLPFITMLLSIAILPMTVSNWWDSNRNKTILSVIVSLPVLAVVMPCDPNLLMHSLLDYVSFLTLLGALFVISGGIYLKGEFAGTPLVNTIFLAVGALLANIIGTTGASMLLIRPYMRANQARQRKSHLIIFFIFMVSNIGGLLTPLGDPPLFLGFLRGVPFHWTLTLIPQWALAVTILLVVFNIFDQYVFVKEDVETPGALAEDVQPHRRIHVQGGINVFYLMGVMGAAILSGYFGWPRGIQESIMLTMAVLSWYTTPRAVHHANHFHFHPIAEVAALFLGIFITMIPALEILHARAVSLDLKDPWQFFWMSGALSSFLDNAPTYLTFTAMASGLVGGRVDDLSALLHSGAGEALLAAVSCGSVFMGANTYIGNGPNFMVKSIAERSGIKMPSFGGYMLYSGLILIPLFLVMTFVFF